MSLTYIQKLREAFEQVKGGELPKDIVAMGKLNELLLQPRIYGKYDAPQAVFKADQAEAIVKAISDIVDGRVERILKVLEEEAAEKHA